MPVGNQDDDSDSNSNNFYPFAWVLIPIVCFGLIAALLTCYRYRRRRRMQAAWEQDAPQRDPEAIPPNYLQLPREPGRTWIGRPRRPGLGVGSRDEGLNELGEAPPAYTASQKDRHAGPIVTEGVELRNMGNGPDVATVPAATAEAGMSSGLPRYEEARQQGGDRTQPGATTTSPTNEPAAPPRAVLPFG
ncbi:hypothetical protein F5X99DRAFT_145739 [Biscogniauxia marginata]|nr:hypothetical protein F5X99DRAFT_145739 [Biscogniauxia marginata]